MIIAIEGPSAAGKTTWCRKHCPDSWVEEAAENIAAPDLYSDPHDVAQFWINFAIQNWKLALDMEQNTGLAICDGDPFHLYYSWSLWKSGVLASTLFEVETELYRHALEKKQIGFVDLVLWLDVPTEELRRRARSDASRRRKRHEMLLGLVPWMEAWYEARKQILPGTVCDLRPTSGLQELLRACSSRRYDSNLLAQILEKLLALGRNLLAFGQAIASS